MKPIFLLATALGLAWLPQGIQAATPSTPGLSASFTLVKGKVVIEDKKGNNRTAHTGSTVHEGETVHVHLKASASLKLFDESTLDLKPGTNLLVSSLKQPSEKDKNIKFVLKVGSLLAKVKKLLTSKSSFEIEGGGVVCGVRGTEFEFSYNPDNNQVDLHVFEGSVFTTANGENTLFKAGDQMQFLNGLLQAPSAPQQNPGPAQNTSGSSTYQPPANNSNQSDGSTADQNLNTGVATDQNAGDGGTYQSSGGGSDQTMSDNFDQTSWDSSTSADSTCAIGDLTTQYNVLIGMNGDVVFVDPSVMGAIRVTVHANVPTVETHP